MVVFDAHHAYGRISVDRKVKPYKCSFPIFACPSNYVNGTASKCTIYSSC